MAPRKDTLMSTFETGSTNWETNEFILCANNDERTWSRLMRGYKPSIVFTLFPSVFKSIDDIENLDFDYINGWFEEAYSDYKKENGTTA